MSKIINYEIKAKSENVEFIRNYLLKNGAKNIGVDFQKDTYFKVPVGRLKLREGNIENSLIFYNREEVQGVKLSHINLVKLSPHSGMDKLLQNANGILTIVSKKREIYFIDNVKFHIDEVMGLGSFIEIEAIDETGNISKEKLKKQCEYYIEIFKIQTTNMIEGSYSDMIMNQAKIIKEDLNEKLIVFFKKISQKLKESKINTGTCFLDHACFRVKTSMEYQIYKNKLSFIGSLLIESMVGGRKIATYKLFQPIIIENRQIDVIELPEPKENNTYETGFEHVEYVIKDDFDTFSKRHNHIDFDWSAADKKTNPELRFKIDKNTSVKFHHQSLEDVIQKELELLTSH
jgi:adenylate cyclase class 2